MIWNLFRPESVVRFPGQLQALGLAFASPFERSYSLPPDRFFLGLLDLLLLGRLIVFIRSDHRDRVFRHGLRPSRIDILANVRRFSLEFCRLCASSRPRRQRVQGVDQRFDLDDRLGRNRVQPAALLVCGRIDTVTQRVQRGIVRRRGHDA